MKKVVIASESNNFLQRNITFLGRRGFRIFSETCGAEVLNLHDNHQFDLILTDDKLDDMHGHSLCSHVKNAAHLRQVPVIIVSHNIPKHINAAEQSGASKVLLKPITPEKLLTTITDAIDIQITKNIRIALNVEVICKKEKAEFFCNAIDISNTGILLESDKLDVGNTVICHFAFPNSEYVVAEGEVVRSVPTIEGKSLCGVFFKNNPMSCLRTIFNYVTSKSASASTTIIPHYLHQQDAYA